MLSLADRTVSTATAQTITCSITGLSQDSSVTWIDPDNSQISVFDTGNYVIDQATYVFGNKQPTLTIKASKLSSLTTGDIFKCQLRSSLYSLYSPDVTDEMVLTLLNLGTSSQIAITL